MTQQTVTRALVRTVSRSLAACELAHLPRQTLNLETAREQHAGYVAALEHVGVAVTVLPEAPALPDATFVEDTVVLLDEVAIVCRLGALSRQPESELMEREVARIRPVRRISVPGTLEGGDVLRMGKTLYVGFSSRTNEEGIRQLREIVLPLGYAVNVVPVRACLHLKTGVTSPADDLVVLNPAWIEPDAFGTPDVVRIPESEPWGANILAVNGTVFVADTAPRTAELLAARNLRVQSLAISELQKAEAGLTCLSVLFGERR